MKVLFIIKMPLSICQAQTIDLKIYYFRNTN